MNTRRVANAVVRRLEATTPVYDVDAPLEGDVRIAPCVREDVGGWAR